MNTLNLEAKLAKKYKYKPLPRNLSEKVRDFYKKNIPEWLKENGNSIPLYTNKGSLIAKRYTRIVIGDYGAFIEFETEDIEKIGSFRIAPGQEYRIEDERYSKNVKYIWLTVYDGSGIKIYFQKKGVSYADYKPGKYYISVHEVLRGG